MNSAGWLTPEVLDGLLAATLLGPLLLALALAAPRLRTAALALAPWVALPGLVLAFAPPFESHWPGLLVDTRLGLDATSRIFLGFSAPLWLIAGLYARAHLAGDPLRHRCTAFLLATLSGNLGVVLALDVASFYGFFTLMTFSAYGLIVHEGGEAARRAGRVYLILAVFGEILLFPAFLLSVQAADSLFLPTLPAAVAASPARALIVGLLLAGFGVKVGALGLHLWLPLVYPAAPLPASAALSSAVIKAGVLGWLRFLPLGETVFADWGYGCALAGLVAAFYGVAVGLVQRDARTVLAYSSISQMGLITLPVGLGLALPAAGPVIWTAVALSSTHHALAKGTLFLGIGVLRAGGRDSWRRRRILAGLLLPALALAGAPFTSGALAKAALQTAAGSLPEPWAGWLRGLLSLAAVGTTLLLARFFHLARQEAGRNAPGPGLAWPWGLALLSTVGLSVLLFPAAAATWFEHPLDPSRRWSEAWPPLAGLALASLFGAAFLRHAPVIPAGDLLIPLERWASRLSRAGSAPAGTWPKLGPRVRAFLPAAHTLGRASALLGHWQSRLDRLPVVGVFLLLLMLLFVLALIPAG